MPAINLAAAADSGPLSHLRNNTAKWWFRDAGLRRLAVAIAVGFAGSINMGYDASLIAGLMANPEFLNAVGNPDSNKLGLIVSALSLGMIPALLFAPYIADTWGRRAGMGSGYVVILAGGCVQTFTTGGWNMLAGRFVLGFGTGLTMVSSAPYVGEIAHPRNRAQTGALINTCFYIGSIIAAWVSFGALNINGSWSWRLCTVLQIGVPILATITLPFMPESPRFLISKGRDEQAHQMLAKYHANGDLNDELVLFELEEIKEAIEAERNATAGVTYLSFLKTKGNRHRLLIVISTAVLSQWVGNGIISYYLVEILNSVGITDSTQQTGFNGGLQIFNWLAAIGGSLVCERFGRRKMWLTSAFGMLISYIIITACSAAYAEKGQEKAGPAVLAFLFIYFGFYDIAFTGLSLAYPLEILPFSLRTKGMSLFMFFLSCAGFFNSYVNPIALAAIAWKYYIVYICVIVFAIVIIYFYFPETKGLMLEEIAVIFDGESAVLPAQANLKDELNLKHEIQNIEYSEDKAV